MLTVLMHWGPVASLVSILNENIVPMYIILYHSPSVSLHELGNRTQATQDLSLLPTVKISYFSLACHVLDLLLFKSASLSCADIQQRSFSRVI